MDTKLDTKRRQDEWACLVRVGVGRSETERWRPRRTRTHYGAAPRLSRPQLPRLRPFVVVAVDAEFSSWAGPTAAERTTRRDCVSRRRPAVTEQRPPGADHPRQLHRASARGPILISTRQRSNGSRRPPPATSQSAVGDEPTPTAVIAAPPQSGVERVDRLRIQPGDWGSSPTRIGTVRSATPLRIGAHRRRARPRESAQALTRTWLGQAGQVTR